MATAPYISKCNKAYFISSALAFLATIQVCNVFLSKSFLFLHLGKLQLFRLLDYQKPNVRLNFQVGSVKPNADLLLPEPRPRSSAQFQPVSAASLPHSDVTGYSLKSQMHPPPEGPKTCLLLEGFRDYSVATGCSLDRICQSVEVPRGMSHRKGDVVNEAKEKSLMSNLCQSPGLGAPLMSEVTQS